MRIVCLALVSLVAAACAGGRSTPDAHPAREEAEAPPADRTEPGPAVSLPAEPGYAPAPGAEGQEGEPGDDVRGGGEEAQTPAIPEDAPAQLVPPPVAADLPPEGDPAAWVAPEIRTLAQWLQETDVPPSALYYVGGTHAGGCLELYTFRFYYGTRERYSDVAGFENLDDAAACQAIVEEQGEPIPERLGVFLVDFSEEIAAEPAITQRFLEKVSSLPVGRATEIPREATPFGAEPGTVIRRRQPPPL